MSKGQGFCLIEVLVCLLLVSSISLGFLQQQWQAQRLYNQVILRARALFYLDNYSEQWLAGQPLSINQPLFQLTKTGSAHAIKLQLIWQAPGLAQQHLQRQLVIGDA